MPTNIGELNYEIVVTGNFKMLEELEARVDALQKKQAAVAKEASGGGGRSRKSSDPVANRILALENQLKVARSDQVALLQSELDLLKKASKADQLRAVNANKTVSSLNAQLDGTIQIEKATEKLAKNQASIAEARARGLTTEKQLASATGLGVKRLREIDPLLRNNALNRKRILDLQKRQADAQAKANADQKKFDNDLFTTKSALAAQRNKEEQQAADNIKRTKDALAAQRAKEDIGLQASLKNLELKKSLAIKEQQYNQLMATGNMHKMEAARLVGLSADEAKRLGIHLFDAQQVARQFLFTFRRLVGILFIFTVARELAGAIARGVKEMSRFNAELESAGLGIATIVSSVGQVVDSQGNLVTGQEAFKASLEASKGVVEDLKKAAVGSIATFQGLVQAYQVAVGPGLAAGLNLDQIKEVSVALTEGAMRMGIPLNQLSEEIRSLLQGTSTARNTRIAVLFGGAKEANEAIRQAKEQGNLYEVLMDKLAGVKAGADAAASSMEVLKSNLQDTIQILLAEGGVEQFLQLKEAIAGFTNELRGFKEGQMFNPAVIGVVQEIAGTLAGVSHSFREVTDTGQAFVLLRNILATVGDALKALAPLASAAFQGLITGVNLVLAPLRLVADILRSAFGKPLNEANKLMAKIVKYAIAGAVAFSLWQKSMVAITTLFGAKGLLGFLKKVVLYLAVVALQAQGLPASIATTMVLTQGWLATLRLVATQLLLIGGPITIVLGVVGLLLVKFKVFERLIGVFNKDMSEAGKNAKELEYGLLGAANATEEGVKSAKEWADEIRNLQYDLAKAQGLKGLTGATEEYASLLYESLSTLEEQTRQSKEQQKLAKERVLELTKEIDALKEKEKLGKSENYFRPSAVSTYGGLGYDVLVDVDKQNAESLKKLEAERNAQLERYEQAKKEIAEREAYIKQQLDLQVKILREKYPVELASVEASKRHAEATKNLTELLYENANVSVRNLANAKAQNEVTKREIDLARAARQLEYDQTLAAIKRATTDEAITVLKNEAVRLDKEGVYLTREEDALLANQTKELERQQAILSSDFTAGLSLGLSNFVKELPALGEQLAEIVGGALSDLAGTVASTFKDAIDPRKDADLKTAFGEFFLDLAGSFVEALTQQLLSSAITKIGLGAKPVVDPTLLSNTTATEMNTRALDRLNAALSSGSANAALSSGSARQTIEITKPPGVPTAAPAAGAGAEVAKQQGIGAMLGGLAQAHPFFTAIIIGLITSLMARAFKKGGQVKGYASGGSIAESLPRPSSIPASDTVPAWLTPGEYVIRKDAVQKYGLGVLNAINSGILNPRSFSRVGSTLLPARGVQHFASGGAVRSSSSQSNSKQVPQTIVLPVLPATETTMDQMIAGGRTAFSRNMNKVNYVGDPNRSSSW